MTNPPAPLLVAEVHVDDLALERGARFADAEALVRAIAEAAETAGARLGFRFRQRFASESRRRDGGLLLRRLESSGHEVGTHAHGRDLERAQRAVSACGVANQGVAPGMVQAGSTAGRLFDRCRKLGFRWIVDHPPFRAWAFGGHLPWRPGAGYRPDRPAAGMTALETSVDPFAWGLLQRSGGLLRHQHGLRAEHFQRLARLLAAHGRRPLPQGEAACFCFTVHEHNFTESHSLAPLADSLQALHDFLAGRRVVPAGELMARASSASISEAGGRRSPRTRAARRLGMVTAPLMKRSLSRQRRVDGVQPGALRVQAGPRQLAARWHGPADPRGLLLLSHAGRSGGTHGLLSPFGLTPRELAAAGIAVVAYDRSGTGHSTGTTPLTPGQGAHVQDFRAVFDALAKALPGSVPMGVLSFSSGILPPLRAGRELAFLMDGEAPADRFSLLPPRGAEAPRDLVLAALDLADDRAWRGMEPASLLAELPCRYHRLQAEYDHVHGRLAHHAQLMLEAARAAGCPSVRCNGQPGLCLLPGRLHAHGRSILRWILEAFDAVS